MKKSRKDKVLYIPALFVVLAVIVFAVAFFLNFSYQKMAIDSIQVRLYEDLAKEASRLRWMLFEKEKLALQPGRQEKASGFLQFPILYRVLSDKTFIPSLGMKTAARIRDMFADDVDPEIISQLIREIIESLPDDENNQLLVVPAFMEPLIVEEREPGDALESLWLGLEEKEADESKKARQHFKVAEQILVEDQEARYVEMCTQLHLIQTSSKRHFLRRLYYMLYLMTESRTFILDDSQIHFFENQLKQIIPDFEIHKAHSKTLWEDARRISLYRTAISDLSSSILLDHEQVLILNAAGYAAIIQFDSTKLLGKRFYLSTSNPNSTHPPSAPCKKLDFLSDVWLCASDAFLDEQHASIDRQCRIINIALSLLMVLTAALIAGSTYVFIHEHELALLRTGFIATVSHELRTPLSLIQLHAETIYHDRAKPEKIKGYLRTIVAETERMTGLVNNVVDYSRLDSLAYSPNPKRCNLSRLCDTVVREFQYRFDTEGVQFSKIIPSGVMAHIDPQTISQVIFNLMDNAIKYSGDSKYVAFELRQDAECIQLRVMDHGIGIPDRIKPRIFEAFFRASDRRVTEQRGSGIGLSVVKDLLEKSGCTIQVADVMPFGTIFTVNIPRKNR